MAVHSSGLFLGVVWVPEYLCRLLFSWIPVRCCPEKGSVSLMYERGFEM